MMNNNDNIKVLWNDVSIFSPQRNHVLLSIMETRGSLEKETDEFIVVKDPTTINTKTNAKHPETTPTFYFIPKGIIREIIKI